MSYGVNLRTPLSQLRKIHWNQIKDQETRIDGWMDNEILDLMKKERRRYKIVDPKEYREILRKTKIAKQQGFQGIEDLQRQHDMFNLYKKIKQTASLKQHIRLELYTTKITILLERNLKEYLDGRNIRKNKNFLRMTRIYLQEHWEQQDNTRWSLPRN